jgi:hypothetical protein
LEVGRIDQDWKAFNAGGLKWQGHFAHELNHGRDARATFAAEGMISRTLDTFCLLTRLSGRGGLSIS